MIVFDPNLQFGTTTPSILAVFSRSHDAVIRVCGSAGNVISLNLGTFPTAKIDVDPKQRATKCTKNENEA